MTTSLRGLTTQCQPHVRHVILIGKTGIGMARTPTRRSGRVRCAVRGVHGVPAYFLDVLAQRNRGKDADRKRDRKCGKALER
ncbi:hypothetical protein Bcep1808_6238 [Burkholderia vietnamiensis G4]|uniref:Uncharacterized protein n=1 Tax=Burkholderia vietnamiensis (strain G4 / LMG 22486) TaxID=269482 RepID=A4JS89_BURVG|nr:hypothetical protein Bcep1808_6238 [Burkholderia vietnamiensis G4]